MKELYGRYIESSFDKSLQADFKFIQFENNYRRYFPDDRGASLLDIGVGRGEMLTLMKKWGFSNSMGVDISESSVRHCRMLGLECELASGTDEWLGERKGFFDLVTLLDVLEHVSKEHLTGFLSAIRESLKDDGRVIIQVPNMQAPDSNLHRYNDITHEVGFTENSLSQLLLTAGFSSFTFHRFEDTITKHPKELLRLFLRSIYWRYVAFIRHIAGNLSTGILTPILFAVVDRNSSVEKS